jgi:hypothetical protein
MKQVLITWPVRTCTFRHCQVTVHLHVAWIYAAGDDLHNYIPYRFCQLQLNAPHAGARDKHLELLSIFLCQYTVQDTVNHLPTPILFPHSPKQIEKYNESFLASLALWCV